jgi:putative SOS response-associated peptidase YedK
MCGAYAAISNIFTNNLTDTLSVPNIETRNIRVPASTIQIITQNQIQRQLIDAKWWLMLNKDGSANYKYSTFNSRSDKLFSSRLTKSLFKQSRCIIPASGFIEGQNKKYHYITANEQAIALGGVYKQYKIDGEIITTASIITCPGENPKLENIHKKSLPLMLDYHDKNLVDMWLEPSMTDSEAFRDLLTNKIGQNLIATPIMGARNLEPQAEPLLIPAD